MDSLVLRERLEIMVLREILVPLALLDPLVPLDLRFVNSYIHSYYSTETAIIWSLWIHCLLLARPY